MGVGQWVLILIGLFFIVDWWVLMILLMIWWVMIWLDWVLGWVGDEWVWVSVLSEFQIGSVREKR